MSTTWVDSAQVDNHEVNETEKKMLRGRTAITVDRKCGRMNEVGLEKKGTERERQVHTPLITQADETSRMTERLNVQRDREKKR